MTRVYDRRRRFGSFLAKGETFRVRFAARASAVTFLGAVIFHGLLSGGYFDYDNSPWLRIPGKLAGVIGMAAEDIKIHGLTHHEPETLLAAVGVVPGGSLMGFDPLVARRILENLDWVSSAQVQRLFPNQLDISVIEREPFAVWQRDNAYFVIDRSGTAMSGLPAAQMVNLPLVSGEGANVAAEELVNQLEAYPDLMLQVKAASRVGQRRWNLYLDSGVVVMLPENGWPEAIAEVHRLDQRQRLLSKGIKSVDLRLGGQVTVAVAEIAEDKDARAKRTSVSNR
ncbi:MAG: cell division protein FtsQ/DivIB [Alphaproteobacteria bacterium]|nr:cell division protein FtsQ/DivIB [Alphaproteobacteria bacterium]